jgi:hypothetical protein
MRRHTAADFGLFADNHGLQDARVLEAEIASDGSILLGDRGFGEGGVQVVEVVADLVDGTVFGLCEGACRVESIWWIVLLDRLCLFSLKLYDIAYLLRRRI